MNLDLSILEFNLIDLRKSKIYLLGSEIERENHEIDTCLLPRFEGDDLERWLLLLLPKILQKSQ
jgi:hypothetical protein